MSAVIADSPAAAQRRIPALRHTRLAGPTVLVAAVLIVFPLLEAVLTTLPLTPSATNWRFGAAGLLSQAIMTPLLGDLMIVWITVLGRTRRFLRIWAMTNGLVAVVLLVLMSLFVLDAIEMRARTNPDFLRNFDLAATVALLKMAIGFAGTLWMGRVSWLAARGGSE